MSLLLEPTTQPRKGDLTKKARCHHVMTSGFRHYCRQRPTLPRSFPRSTIGGIRLNFRVRNGNGCDPDPMTTGKVVPGDEPGILSAWGPSAWAQRFTPRNDSRLRSSQTIL